MNFQELKAQFLNGTINNLKPHRGLDCAVCDKHFVVDTYELKRRLNSSGVYDAYCSNTCGKVHTPHMDWNRLVSDFKSDRFELLPSRMTLECHLCSTVFVRERHRVMTRLRTGHEHCFCGKACASSHVRTEEARRGIVPAGNVAHLYNSDIGISREGAITMFSITIEKERKLNHSFARYRYAAKRRGYSFNLTRQFFYKMIMEDCKICGREGGGVDRWINTIGYERSNCIPCCGECNTLKGTMNGLEFLVLVNRIAKQQATVA